jgi:hypothetical protein
MTHTRRTSRDRPPGAASTPHGTTSARHRDEGKALDRIEGSSDQTEHGHDAERDRSPSKLTDAPLGGHSDAETCTQHAPATLSPVHPQGACRRGSRPPMIARHPGSCLTGADALTRETWSMGRRGGSVIERVGARHTRPQAT